MIDTHTHLYSEEFNQDREQVIQQAKEIGVKKFFLPAIDSHTHHAMLNLENQYPDCMYAMMGLHPCSVKEETFENELKEVKKYLLQRKFSAIGEIGIDLYWDKTTLEIQKKVFKTQIEWALELHLPIVIHSRESFDEILEILEIYKNQNLSGIFHCFTGSLQQAQKILDKGFFLGIGGVVTFKNGKIDQFLNQIPIEKIVIETDAPYLTPTPYRGKRNESAYLGLVVDKLAEIYQKDRESIIKITTENANKVFNEYK